MHILRLQDAINHQAHSTTYDNTWVWPTTKIFMLVGWDTWSVQTVVAVQHDEVLVIDGLHTPEQIWSEISMALLPFDIICESILNSNVHLDLPDNMDMWSFEI